MVPSHSSGLSLSLELTLCLLQAWCIASMFPQPSIYSLSIVFIAHSQVQTPKEGRQEKKESSSLKEDNRRLKNQHTLCQRQLLLSCLLSMGLVVVDIIIFPEKLETCIFMFKKIPN